MVELETHCTNPHLPPGPGDLLTKHEPCTPASVVALAIAHLLGPSIPEQGLRDDDDDAATPGDFVNQTGLRFLWGGHL